MGSNACWLCEDTGLGIACYAAVTNCYSAYAHPHSLTNLHALPEEKKLLWCPLSVGHQGCCLNRGNSLSGGGYALQSCVICS
jgi:hypothetical protein